jgi:hypothetical protein
MTTVVLNSAAEIERLTTGKAPERPEIEADNAKQRAAAENKASKPTDKPTTDARAGDKTSAAKVEGDDQDDVEGEDGLTPRQKREFSAQMLKSIGKKHREKLEAEEFAADQYNRARLAEQRAENLERQLEELRKQPAAKVEEPKEPRREDFETQEAYEDARIDWRAEQKFKQKQAEVAAQREQERQAEVIRAATERLQKAAELVPDFQEVTEAAELRVPGHIAGYMQESELFAELGYHFAKHPDVMEKLAKLSPAKALVEVGKIESTLKPFSKDGAATSSEKASNGTTPSSKTESASQTAANGNGAGPTQTESSPSAAGPSPKSRAPVIRPLGSDSVSQVEKDPSQMTTREVIEKWKRDNPRTNLGLRKRH